MGTRLDKARASNPRVNLASSHAVGVILQLPDAMPFGITSALSWQSPPHTSTTVRLSPSAYAFRKRLVMNVLLFL